MTAAASTPMVSADKTSVRSCREAIQFAAYALYSQVTPYWHPSGGVAP